MAGVLLVLVCAVSVVFFKFSSIPINIATDEVAFTRLALELQRSPVMLYSPLETGHTTLYFYILNASFSIFGLNLFALRFPSAFFGVLNCVLVFLLFERVFKDKKLGIKIPYQNISININISFILALVFVFMRWHFNFARFSFEATFLLFLELVSLLYLFLYIEHKKIRFLTMSIIFAGIAFYSYTPGRIFFLVPLSVLLLKKKNLRLEATQPLVLVALWICMIVPLIFQMGAAGGDARVGEEFIFFDSGISVLEKTGYLVENIKKTVLMFGFSGDMNGRHNYPGKAALNPVLFIFFVAGLVRSLRRRNHTDMIFLIFFAVSIMPTIFTHPTGNPNMLRTITAVVPVVYMIGIFIDEVVKSVKFRYISLLIIILLLFSSLYELRTYFIFQKEVTRHSFQVKKNFEWLKEHNFQLVGKWYRE